MDNGNYQPGNYVRPVVSFTPNVILSESGGTIENPRTLSLK